MQAVLTQRLFADAEVEVGEALSLGRDLDLVALGLVAEGVEE